MERILILVLRFVKWGRFDVHCAVVLCSVFTVLHTIVVYCIRLWCIVNCSLDNSYILPQHGCVPVVLSDDLVWAYSTETGGFLDPDSFSIQLPQKVRTFAFTLSCKFSLCCTVTGNCTIGSELEM